MDQLVCLTLSSSQMKFAAAHFTIFSETQRENLHGHNFTVTAKLYGPLQQDGLMFNYEIFKLKFASICKTLDEKLLLPEQSSYLSFGEKKPYITVGFHDETMLFLPRDIYILPVANISVECLAQFFLQELLKDEVLIKGSQLQKIKIKVASSPAQEAEVKWHKI